MEARGQETPDHAPRQSTWARFLEQKTTVQRVLLAVGALATAVLAIGAVIAGLAAFLDDDSPHRGGADTGTVQDVVNQEDTADDFVRFLLDAAGGRPVQLDHRVAAPRGDGGQAELQYDCAAPTGCSFVRVEAGDHIPNTFAGGVWYQGCWAITKDGAGYGAGHLDLELSWRGATCPA